MIERYLSSKTVNRSLSGEGRGEDKSTQESGENEDPDSVLAALTPPSLQTDAKMHYPGLEDRGFSSEVGRVFSVDFFVSLARACTFCFYMCHEGREGLCAVSRRGVDLAND